MEGITAGQRGGLDRNGSRSLPRQGRGQDGQPKIAAKERCYLRFWVELRGFEPLTPSMRTRCATGLRYSPKNGCQRSKRSGLLARTAAADSASVAHRAVHRVGVLVVELPVDPL